MMQVIKKEFEVALVQQQIEHKKSILQLRAVRERLPARELRIAELGAGLPLGKIPDRDLQIVNGEEKDRGLIARCGIIAKGIARDFSIRNLERTEGFRFYDILKKYYSGLTLDEVRTAFELALVGELDKYLPKDKNGNPDKNHYQSFSAEFITRILNSFMAYKGKVWSKVYVSSEKEEIEVTEEQKAENRAGFYQVVQEQFEIWKSGGKPEFFFVGTVAGFFIERGYVKDRELTQSDFNQALINVKDSDQLTGHDKAKIFERFREGENTGKLEVEAKRVKDEELILKAFEYMYKSKIEIYESERG